MIHCPGPWLGLLRTTADQLDLLAGADVNALVTNLPELEFRVHLSLFAVRKIDESIGISLHLKAKRFDLHSWPSTDKGRISITRHSDPPFEQWYDLKNPEIVALSYGEIIDMFIHARICHFCCYVDSKEEKRGECAVVVASDRKMRERHFKIMFSQIARILRHAIEVFESQIKRKRAGKISL
jgi:hypothetical protein